MDQQNMRTAQLIEGMFLFTASLGGYVYCSNIVLAAQNAVLSYATNVLPSAMSIEQHSQILQMSPDFVIIMTQIIRFCFVGLALIGLGHLTHGALVTKSRTHTPINSPRI